MASIKQPPLNIVDITERLKKAKTDKQIDKIITRAWESDSQEFFLALQYSMDDTYDFHIRKAPEYESSEDDGTSNFSFDDFFNLVTTIKNSKNISIEEIKDLVRDAASKCNQKDWNLVYRQVLLKKYHNNFKMDVIIKSLTRLTVPKGNVKTAIQGSNTNNPDASEILSRN